MTVRIEIQQNACRGCRLCIDVCPTSVFAFDEAASKASVKEPESCIACLSCAWVCPSGAVKHHDYYAVKNYYRDVNFSMRVRRFL